MHTSSKKAIIAENVFAHIKEVVKFPNMIGGCIWEWADRVSPKKDGNFGYGGDFDEETHDGNFCCDGLVHVDRNFKAGTYEVKYAYQPLSTELHGRTLVVLNKYDFADFFGAF